MNIGKGFYSLIKKESIKVLAQNLRNAALINNYHTWIHTRIMKREKGTCTVDFGVLAFSDLVLIIFSLMIRNKENNLDQKFRVLVKLILNRP